MHHGRRDSPKTVRLAVLQRNVEEGQALPNWRSEAEDRLTSVSGKSCGFLQLLQRDPQLQTEFL